MNGGRSPRWPVRASARVARWLLRLGSLVVPGGARRGWRDEWEGELWALDRKGSGPGALVRFALDGIADAARVGSRERREDGMGPEGWLRDLRHALRRLARAPGFTLVSVAVLALGIGANASLLGALRAALLQEPPYPEPERLVVVDHLVGPPGEAPDTLPWSWPKLASIQEEMDFLSAVAGYMDWNVVLGAGAEAERVDVELVSPGYFELLGAGTALGRSFRADEGPPAPGRVVVLAHHAWRDRFGSDPDVVGRTVRIAGEPFEVIGVGRPGFRGLTGSANAWLSLAAAPVVIEPRRLERTGSHWFRAVGRLAPGSTMAEASERARGLTPGLTESFPRSDGEPLELGVALTPLIHARVNPTARVAVGVVGAGATLLLLIALANVAGLFLARTTARSGDLAVRAALGAGKGRLAREVLAESLVVSLAGGAAGLALAFGAQRAVAWAAANALDTQGGRRLQFVDPASLGLDPSILAAGIGLALLCGVVTGLAPARAAVRAALGGGLRSGGRGATGRSGAPGERVRDVLVGLQIAATVVLVSGGGLMLASFRNLSAVPLGFRPEEVVTARYELGPQASPEEIAAFDRALVERLESEPGVDAAAVGVCAPLQGLCDLVGVRRVDGRDLPEDDGGWMHALSVTPGYFELLGIPTTRGRPLPGGLDPDDPPQVVISEAAARRYFPGVDPVGHRIEVTHSATDGRGAEIVGVVGDVVWDGLEDEPAPSLFFSSEQVPAGWGFVVVRTAGASPLGADGLRRTVLGLAPGRPPRDVASLSALVAAASARTRVILGLLAAFGATALVLSAVGLWGLVSQAVARRTREMGLRMALGARAGSVLRTVATKPVALALAGAVLGAVGARIATPRLGALLYQVDPGHVGVLVAAVALLLGVSALAAWIPGRRATRIDPSEALRAD